MNNCLTFRIKYPSVVCCLAMSLAVLTSTNPSIADDSTASPEKELVSKVIAAAGGEENLLTLFRMEERFNTGKERVSPGTSRVSVVEPPKSWWIGKKERGQKPAKITVWAWTLGVLKDEKSKLALIPDVTDSETELAGLQVTVSVDPPIDMYFDKTTHELVRVDWRNDIYRFSEWKEHDGTKYPSKWAMGVLVTVKVNAEDAGGAYSVFEDMIPPGAGPVPHTHTKEDETIFLLEGELRAWLGGKQYDMKVGDFVHMPRGVQHYFKNVSDEPTRLLLSYTPGGFEQWFLDVGKPFVGNESKLPEIKPDDIKQAVAAAEKYGVKFEKK